ncbi:MAG: hypothetical protein OXT67_07770, partial [Zetaproteobacteria bacterium]|nr:hypothetical protein [Zetaproteobacteria bacterium]
MDGKRWITLSTKLGFLLAIALGCGRAGDQQTSSEESASFAIDLNAYADRTGYISAHGSSQDALSGWVIAILDAE